MVPASPPPRRLIVAITGAAGVVYGVRLLQLLRELPGIESHLMISDAGVLNLHQELEMRRKQVEALADVVHNVRDIGASIASGSFQSDGMIVAPCSMKTLASVAHGLSDNLIARAADVVLKERRRLICVVRETPYNLVHIRNMETVTLAGGIICPATPSFYSRPATLTDVAATVVDRVLDLAGLRVDTFRWGGA